ncbi:50S ribosomal protein L23 [Candidatus Saccharibacteria bacterium]|nr:50S ribosomal protein L23 [Candidatus Saccharibacteria bacterium]
MAKAEKATKTKVKKAEVVKPVYLPRATEKAYFEQTKRTYIFVAPLKASKMEIKAGVAKEYNVTVEDVRVLTRKGKKTRFSRGKHAYPGTTFRQDHKFAYVTLKEGDKIAVFEEEETSKPAEKADKKAEKKAEKKATKAEKKGDK